MIAPALMATAMGQSFPLPVKQTFIGKKQFAAVVAQAQKENWSTLSMNERVARFGLAFRGTPYKGFTLEIDDRVESPSANLHGMDCWTFFEIALGLARMIDTPRNHYTPEHLLREIRHTRYRNGQCRGDYLERIHYLVEWYTDNHRRKNIVDLTGKLGGVKFRNRSLTEMSDLWKSYRYLRKNPELRPRMAAIERQLTKRGARYIPREKVRSIENKIQSGDIIGIATNKDGVFCSHVGLALRTTDGKLRLMHASSDKKKVIVDAPLTEYLYRYNKNAGILVGRPLTPRRR